MTPMDIFVLAVYTVSSLMAFFSMGIDKWRARKRARRIPERTLLLWCWLFGALGGWLGMKVFRHKTRDAKFTVAVPTLMILQVALITLYFAYWR